MALATYAAKVVCRSTTKSSGEHFVHQTVFEADPAYSSLAGFLSRLSHTKKHKPMIFKPKVRQKSSRESSFDHIQHLHQCRNTDLGKSNIHGCKIGRVCFIHEHKLAGKPPVDQVQETLQRRPSLQVSQCIYIYIYFLKKYRMDHISCIESYIYISTIVFLSFAAIMPLC